MMRVLSFLIFFCMAVPQISWSQAPANMSTPPNMSTPSAMSEILSKEDLKASLIIAWEKNISKDPDTKLFKKTNEPDVYYVQTDLLPYKGRIKIMNLVIRPYTPTAEYDKGVAFGGIVETGLVDAPESALNKASISAQEWGRLNWFNYDKKKEEWFPTSSWSRRFPNAKNVKIETPMQTYQELPSYPDTIRLVTDIGADVCFIMFFFFSVVFGIQQRKILWKSREENSQLLKEILTAIKKK